MTSGLAQSSSVFTTVVQGGVLPVSGPGMGFDLARTAPDSFIDFYARGRPASRYVYRVPWRPRAIGSAQRARR
jgi:hypothetical protein